MDDVVNPNEGAERYADEMIRRQAAFLAALLAQAQAEGTRNSAFVLDAALRALPVSRMALLEALEGATFGEEAEQPELTFDGAGRQGVPAALTPPHLTAKDSLAAAARLHRSLFACARESVRAGEPFETAMDRAFGELLADAAGLSRVGRRLRDATYDTPATAASFCLMWRFLVESGPGRRATGRMKRLAASVTRRLLA